MVRRSIILHLHRPVEELISLTKPSGKELNSKDRPDWHLSWGIGLYLQNRGDIKKLVKPFEGQIVVDLGSGRSAAGYSLARAAKASSYIGVEKYYPRLLEDALQVYSKNKSNFGWDIIENPLIPYAIFPGDMLDFLTRIPKDSVSMIMSAINAQIIPGSCDDLAQEMIRVLHPKGAILSYNSRIRFDDVLRSKSLIPHDDELMQYRK